MTEYTSLKKWLETWGDQAANPVLVDLHHDLVYRYSESDRFYHNLNHISMCLQEFAEVASCAENRFDVELAIWYHDVIYDPRRRDNEEMSANYATSVLNELLEREALDDIHELIRLTAHNREPKSIDESIMIDIDLAILGKPLNEFLRYEEVIRREYAWVPLIKYKKGRAELLSRFLRRKYIYYTEHFREKYEEKARDNLSYSISKKQ